MKPDLIIKSHWDFREEFKAYFGCEKFWVELEVERSVEEEKKEQLKDMLSHKWLILIINKKGTYEIIKPYAYEAFDEFMKYS